MNEYLLQYLWKHALFAPHSLVTTEGEPLTVIKPGQHNLNAGPDFLEATIKIGTTTWVGNVELHLHTSDWLKHRHEKDPNYQNIVLHVVYEDDFTLTGCNFPTLELKSALPEAIIARYRLLMSAPDLIPCAKNISSVPDMIWDSWLERLLAERWEERARDWQQLWTQCNQDWRTMLYYCLAANFGFHVNKEPFLQLARSLPLQVLTRHRKNLLQTEALLFGQSGLLQAVTHGDEYTRSLEKEYHFLRRKYALEPINSRLWKFMRMRPANFPTVRLAQFAMLVHTALELFAKMMEITDAAALHHMLNISASGYWDRHFRLGVEGEQKEKRLGHQAVQNLLINTVAPMQYFYAKMQGEVKLFENSLRLLSALPPEQNAVLKGWKAIGKIPKDAAQSQAMLQLYRGYCMPKQCLNCSIGHKLLHTDDYQ